MKYIYIRLSKHIVFHEIDRFEESRKSIPASVHITKVESL